jgi:DNA invertase Pin-like site-specific DNA recombinase
LDTSLKLEDRGVSGFRGEHRTNPKHALARFLDEVNRGRVPRGSYLIVENLDRLTREQFEEAVPAVLALIKAGVRVVQLTPVEVVYEPDMDEGRKLLMIMELSRGHAESKRKSGMVAEVWGEKKANARSGTPHGKAVPAWLELASGKYRIKPDAGRAVRRIFAWAADGLGVPAILKRLHADGVPPIGRKPAWNRAYVTKLLTNPAVTGVYQPMKGRSKREPDGEPVEDYFPRLIADDLWARVQATRSKRGRPGCRRPRSRHVLAGLVVDARDGSVMYVHGHPKVGPMFVSRAAYEGRPNTVWATFPVKVLTDAVLERLVELRADELFSDPGAARVSELTTRLNEVERRLRVALERFDADPDSPTWATQVDKYDRQKRSLVAELTAARQEAAHPLSANWAEAVELMAANEPERLRAALNRTVEEVRVLVVKRTTGRLAAVQARFHGGAVRNYVVFWKYRHWSVPKKGFRPYTVEDFAAPGLKGEMDLRDPKHVADLERVLAAVELTAKKTLGKRRKLGADRRDHGLGGS